MMGSSQSAPPTVGTKTESHGQVLDLINSTKVLIFSATYCGYCRVAKKLFESIGTEYHAIEVDKLGDKGRLITELRKHTGSNYVSKLKMCR